MKTYKQQFMAKTRGTYTAMRKRFAEKRDKNDRLIRVGREIPFTLEQFREKALAHFEGEYSGCVPCPYCQAWVTVSNMATDHEVPVSRGGSLGLDNIGFPCSACNFRKGKLTPNEYKCLLAALSAFPEAARADVLHRLEIAVQLAAQSRFRIQQQARKPKPQQEATQDVDNF